MPSDEAILACSDSNGYNMSGDKGKSCIKASANLLYFNRESAGTVYFYFVGNSLSGLYYTPFNTNIPCSLHVRNAYLIPDSFGSIETSDEEEMCIRDSYDYDAKYNNSDSKTVVPAEISKEKEDEIRKIAVKVFKAVDGSGLARVDFFVEKDTENVIFNELNTLPGFTPISMYSMLWAACGKPMNVLLDELIDLALERFGIK